MNQARPVPLALPVDSRIGEIVAAVRDRKRAVIVAPPGSGKTTRIPPALIALGRTILLQPRRVAARALARRIAAERGWTIGNEIGWHIRFERRFSKATRLLVATEGILTARLQSDPLISDFDVIVLDEFHERSIHADLALAMARQAALSRPDLALVVMSATIDAAPLAQFLDAPVIAIDARTHPVAVQYMNGATVADAVRRILPDAKGHVLAFLPGAREIERTAADLPGLNVFPLHGRLDVEAQERALAPSRERKIILATNVAETSLTVEGVTDVVDGGLQKVLRYDSDTAVDHLVTEQISAASAAQRAGRAGRTAPGRATRLWDERAILRPYTDPEVRRIDLAGPVLDIVAWGGDPRTFEWYEKPPEARIDAAMELLAQLGAVDGRRLTPLGEKIRRYPLHPRLARLIVAANGSREAIELAAEIAEGRPNPEVVRELTELTKPSPGGRGQRETPGEGLPQAALAAYPDRVAMRRGAGLLLSSGTGATLAREIAHLRGDFFVALEVRGELVHRAIPIERDWLEPTHSEISHSFDGDRVRAVKRNWYGALLLHEESVTPDAGEAREILARELAASVDDELRRRAAVAGLNIDWVAIARAATVTRVSEMQWRDWLPHDVRRRLDELAPLRLPLPSGRSAPLEYREDGSVVAAAKLQELFGLADTPRVGAQRKPVTFALLAPNGRPVQVTQDLRSFWNGAYQEVRKELRGRYPKHPWPDDPWTAAPTHRTRRR